jgi:hypothetical protein
MRLGVGSAVLIAFLMIATAAGILASGVIKPAFFSVAKEIGWIEHGTSNAGREDSTASLDLRR